MHIDVVPNRNSRPAYLLRESYREGQKVKKRTIANLSALPDEQIAAIRAVLRGAKTAASEPQFEILRSRQHGHIEAVNVAMSRLKMPALLGGPASPERNLVLAMIAARVVAPDTKLATARWWGTTTLTEDFAVAEVDADALYAAMDWLLLRQDAIQKRLAARHLPEDSVVLYDLSSSYFEGTQCPLARLGYNRDGKHGKLQVNYGLLADVRGCPVAVSVHEGNTADPSTLMPQVRRLKDAFGIQKLVLVGDRGMISHKAVDQLRREDGISWISALKSSSIRALIESGAVQFGLFDERNLFEMAHPDYPDERLVVCRNPELAKLRAHKREALLAATAGNLERVRTAVAAGRLKGQDKIGVRVGKVINQYKVAKHFTLDIQNDVFNFQRNLEGIAAEAALDGIYIIRTSVPVTRMDSADCVRHYKALANVERAFRAIKTIDLHVRPIHHRTADRVRAHIFLCMLAYYVEWHMREAWRELMFADEDQSAKRSRDPVAPAVRSEAAMDKVTTRTLNDGTQPHSFATLLAHLATIVRNTCRASDTPHPAATFEITTLADAKQKRALELLARIAL